jgi:hypothetical protein
VLCLAVVRVQSAGNCEFQVVTPQRVYALVAASEQEMKQWVADLDTQRQRLIRQSRDGQEAAANLRRGSVGALSSPSSAFVAGSGRPQPPTRRAVHTMTPQQGRQFEIGRRATDATTTTTVGDATPHATSSPSAVSRELSGLSLQSGSNRRSVLSSSQTLTAVDDAVSHINVGDGSESEGGAGDNPDAARENKRLKFKVAELERDLDEREEMVKELKREIIKDLRELSDKHRQRDDEMRQLRDELAFAHQKLNELAPKNEEGSGAGAAAAVVASGGDKDAVIRNQQREIEDLKAQLQERIEEEAVKMREKVRFAIDKLKQEQEDEIRKLSQHKLQSSTGSGDDALTNEQLRKENATLREEIKRVVEKMDALVRKAHHCTSSPSPSLSLSLVLSFVCALVCCAALPNACAVLSFLVTCLHTALLLLFVVWPSLSLSLFSACACACATNRNAIRVVSRLFCCCGCCLCHWECTATITILFIYFRSSLSLSPHTHPVACPFAAAAASFFLLLLPSTVLLAATGSGGTAVAADDEGASGEGAGNKQADGLTTASDSSSDTAEAGGVTVTYGRRKVALSRPDPGEEADEEESDSDDEAVVSDAAGGVKADSSSGKTEANANTDEEAAEEDIDDDDDNLLRAEALYGFEARNETEISFAKGGTCVRVCACQVRALFFLGSLETFSRALGCVLCRHAHRARKGHQRVVEGRAAKGGSEEAGQGWSGALQLHARPLQGALVQLQALVQGEPVHPRAAAAVRLHHARGHEQDEGDKGQG